MKNTFLKLGKLAVAAAMMLAVGMLFLPASRTQGAPPSREPRQVQQQQKERKYEPGTLIIKLKEGSTLADIADLNNKWGVISSEREFPDTPSAEERLEHARNKLKDIEAKEHSQWYWQMDKNSQEYKEYKENIENEKKELKKIIAFQQELVTDFEARQKKALTTYAPPDLTRWYILSVSNETDILRMADEYKQSSYIEYAHPSYIPELLIAVSDSLYPEQWEHEKIKSKTAWDQGYYGQNVVVAVIDSGVDYNHPDLDHNMWHNEREIPKNNIDDDLNGFVDDYLGWNFVENINDPAPPDIRKNYHGSLVASNLAAELNNADQPGGDSMVGVAPQAKIMALRAASCGPTCRPGPGHSDITYALKYAADNGAKIINMSLGNLGDDVKEAIVYAISKQCLIVESAGNASEDLNVSAEEEGVNYSLALQYPLNFLSAAASNKQDLLAYFSSFGSKVVVAPGQDVLGWYINEGNYRTWSGTSASSPIVAGVAALILSANSDLSMQEVALIIKASCDDIGLPGVDYYYGYGRINVEKALSLARGERLCYINNPADGSHVWGVINIGGFVSPRVLNYTLEYSGPQNGTIVQGKAPDLGSWDTTNLPAGQYQIKLTVHTSDSQEETYTVFVYVENGFVVEETQVSVSAGNQAFPNIYDNRIAWEDDRNANDYSENVDIYTFDLSKPEQGEFALFNNPNLVERRPKLSSNKIAWEEICCNDVEGSARVGVLYTAFLEDYLNKIPLAATSAGNDKIIELFSIKLGVEALAADNADIIWAQRITHAADVSTIHAYSFGKPDTKDVALLTLDGGSLYYLFPAVDALMQTEKWFECLAIVYDEANRVGELRYINSDFYGETTKILHQSGSLYESIPVFYGDLLQSSVVFWKDGYTIYQYNMRTDEKKVFVQGTAVSNPAIYADRLVWVDNRNGNNDIYMYVLSSGATVKITGESAQPAIDSMDYPAIYGSRIVWPDERNAIDESRGTDLYMATLYFKPVITRLRPYMVSPGSELSIQGTGFGEKSGSSKVFFNGIEVGVEEWSDNQIVILVPKDFESGTLVVRNPYGESNSLQIAKSEISPPYDLAVGYDSASKSITLTWDCLSSDVDGFRIERSKDALNWEDIGRTEADVRTFVDEPDDYAMGEYYAYRVYSLRGRYASNYAEEHVIISKQDQGVFIESPSGLRAVEASRGKIYLNWSDNSDNEECFEVHRDTDKLNCATQPYDTDSTVSRETLYRYWVIAKLGDDYSESSNYSDVLTEPDPAIVAPSDLTVTAPSATQIQLSWTDNSNNELAYIVEEDEGAGAGFKPSQAVPGDTTSVMLNYVGYDTGKCFKRSYRVRGYTGISYSEYSNEAKYETECEVDEVKPVAEFNKTPNCSEDGTPFVYLTYYYVDADTGKSTAPPDSYVYEDYKLVRIHLLGWPLYEVAVIPTMPMSTGWSARDASVQPATNYAYRWVPVDTTDYVNIYAWSFYNDVSTCGAPAAPGQCSTKNISADRVTLSWQDTSDVVSGHTIERSSDGGATYETIFSYPGDCSWSGGSVNCDEVYTATSFTDATAASATTYLYRVIATNEDGSSAPSASVTATTQANANLQARSLSPNSGSVNVGEGKAFTATFYDTAGYANIAEAQMKIADATGTNTLFARALKTATGYDLYLSTDGVNWGTGYAHTTGQTINTTYASLGCATSSVSGSGNTLTVKFFLTFKEAFAGDKKISLYLKDNTNASAGFYEMGSVFVNVAPAVGTIAPANGSSYPGIEQVFATHYTDANGAEDLAYADILVNAATVLTDCFYGRYDRKADQACLMQDTTAVSCCKPGEAKTLENNFVKLDCAGTTVTPVANGLDINWKVAFKDTFYGDKKTYARATDNQAKTTNWVEKGIWEVAPTSNLAPTIYSISPSKIASTVNGAKTITLKFKDNNGWEDIKEAQMKVVKVSNPAQYFIVRYVKSENAYYINSSDGTGGVLAVPASGSASKASTFAKLTLSSNTAVAGATEILTLKPQIAITSNDFLSTNDVYLSVTDQAGLTTGEVKKGSWEINNAPTLPDSLGTLPAATTGEAAEYVTTFTDTNGAGDIAEAQVLFATGLTAAAKENGFYARCVREEDDTYAFEVSADAGTTWQSCDAQANAHGSLNCAQSSVSVSGNNLIVTWNITFKDQLIIDNAKRVFNVYLKVTDAQADTAGLSDKGNQTINAGNNLAPITGTLSPDSGAISDDAVFTTTFHDYNTYRDIKDVYLKIVDHADPTNAAKMVILRYEQLNDNLYVSADDNTEAVDVTKMIWSGPRQPSTDNEGADFLISYKFLSLNCTKTVVSFLGDYTTVKWQVRFNDAFVGTKDVYLNVVDAQGVASGWVKKNTGIITVNLAPRVGTLTPANVFVASTAPAAMKTFVTTYSDANGIADLSKEYLKYNETDTVNTNCFYGYYDSDAAAANRKFYLYADDGKTLVKPAGKTTAGCLAGSADTLENSYAILNCASSKAEDQDTTTKKLTWAITFKDQLKTEKRNSLNAYMKVKDDQNPETAWMLVGKRQVNIKPVVGTVTPASGVSPANTAVTLAATYTDDNGWQDLKEVAILIYASTNTFKNVWATYNENENKLYFTRDDGRIFGGVAPGADTVLENSYGQLNCKNTTVSGTGTTLAVNWNITFKPAFAGTKNVYLQAKDEIAQSIQPQKGTWTVQ